MFTINTSYIKTNLHCVSSRILNRISALHKIRFLEVVYCFNLFVGGSDTRRPKIPPKLDIKINIPCFTDSGFYNSMFYRFRLLQFRVLQIPAFTIPCFTDSGFYNSGFYRFRLLQFRVLQIPAFTIPGDSIPHFIPHSIPGFPVPCFTGSSTRALNST